MADMAGLPGLRFGRGQVRPVGVVDQDTGAGDLFRGLSNVAAQIGENAKIDAVKEAKKAGERSVTRDKDGNIVVEKPDYLLPWMNEAHENAAQLRYAVETDKDIDRELADAHFKHANDPAGFEAAVEGIRAGKLSKIPNGDWAPKINDLIDRASGQHLANIRQAKFTADLKATGDAIDAKLEDNSNDLYALAEQGQLQSPEAQRLLNDSIDLVRSKVDNPAFAGYSQERADLDIAEFKSQLETGAIIGQAEAIFKDPNAGPEIAAEWLNAQINDPKLELSPETRSRVRTAGLRRLNDLSQAQSAETAVAQDRKYTELNRLAELGRLPPEEVDAAYERGEISGAAHRTLFNKVIQKTTEDGDLSEAMARASANLPMDPNNATDRKAIDKTYDTMVAQGADPLATVVNMAKLNGVIPERAMSRIRAASLSNDPAMVAGGLDIGRSVIENSPDAIDRMPGGTALANDVERFRQLTREMGFTDQQASQEIVRQRDPAFRARAAQVYESNKDDINALTADDALEAMRPKTWAGWLWGVPEAGLEPGQADHIAADYRALVTQHLKKVGDLNSAKTLAALDMNRTYGATNLFGESTLMKYPPERRYPMVNGSHDYVRQQALEEARVFTNDQNLGPDDVILMPDGVTANDWARQGALPKYGLAVRQMVNGVETWMQLPGGYFRADPKQATVVEGLRADAARFAAGTPDPMSGLTQRVESKPAAQKTPEQQFADARDSAKRSTEAAKAAAAAPDIMSGFTSAETGPAASAKPGGSTAPASESRLHTQLKRDEQGSKGPALKPYKDAHGQSIGWGHFIKPGEEHLKKGITREQAQQLFEQDVQDATNELQTKFPALWNAAETPNRREALINMMFNMGLGNKDRGFSSFTKSIPLMEQGKWDEAAVNLRKSKWFKQTGDRAKRVIKMLVEG